MDSQLTAEMLGTIAGQSMLVMSGIVACVFVLFRMVLR